MTKPLLLGTLVLGALSELALLGLFVFVAEPPDHIARPVRPFHAWEFAYLALPLLLMAASAFLPARALLRRRPPDSPDGQA